MKVFYSPYTLTPLKKANRLSSLDKKSGVFLKGQLGQKVLFADYFPHLPLGDRSVDQFLDEFKFQDEEYDKKVFHHLLQDEKYQKLPPKKFMNHQLWTGVEEIEADVLKYKFLHADDYSFLKPLKEGKRLRLDGNALFTRESFYKYLEGIPSDLLKNIDYFEDPIRDQDWSHLGVPVARDFLTGSPFEYYIYKPACEFLPKDAPKIIYSAYLGSFLGNYHAYCELIQNADLTIPHGVVAYGFHQEEKHFITGNYKNGFIANTDLVNSLYKDLSDREWKSLCSM